MYYAVHNIKNALKFQNIQVQLKYELFFLKERKVEMEVEETILLQIILCSTLLLTKYLKKKPKRRRKIWVKDWLKRRDERGAYNNIISELRLVDLPYYRRYIRMNPATFKVSQF